MTMLQEVAEVVALNDLEYILFFQESDCIALVTKDNVRLRIPGNTDKILVGRVGLHAIVSFLDVFGYRFAARKNIDDENPWVLYRCPRDVPSHPVH